MVKRALCVGCNYPSKAFGLAGAVNDAFLIAECLQKNCGFEPDNVVVLHDIYPGQKKSMKVEPSQKPSRVNILQRLQWLVRSAKPGDVLFFSFAGYGLQVDDMDGYQDEGFDEAILPTDFVDGRDGEYTVIVADDIHDILMGIPNNCSVTVVMDCDHATSVVDVAGTLDGGLVSGLKFHNVCGLKAHTTKVQLASHNRDVWQEEQARNVKARPRFQPMMEIDNPRRGRLPTRPAMSRSTPVAFCYSAAGHGETAMEMQMSRVIDGKDVPKQHGILSWCFVQAMDELKGECNHTELSNVIMKYMNQIRERDLPRMDQKLLLTFAAPRSDPTMRVFQPLASQHAPRGTSGALDSGRSNVVAPAVVPPPPPGFLTNQPGGSAGSRPSTTGGDASDAGNGLPPPPPLAQARGPGLPPGTRSASYGAQQGGAPRALSMSEGLVHYDAPGNAGGSWGLQPQQRQPIDYQRDSPFPTASRIQPPATDLSEVVPGQELGLHGPQGQYFPRYAGPGGYPSAPGPAQPMKGLTPPANLLQHLGAPLGMGPGFGRPPHGGIPPGMHGQQVALAHHH